MKLFAAYIVIALSLILAIANGGINKVTENKEMLSKYIGVQYKNLEVISVKYPDTLMLSDGSMIDFIVVKHYLYNK